MVKTVPSYARSWVPNVKEWMVHVTYALRLVRDMTARGDLVIGREPERRKQQCTNEMYCSSRCRQRAYYRRTHPQAEARR